MKIFNLLELLLLAAFWGASFLFMRIAAPVLGPVCLIELRVLLAGLALSTLLIRLNLLAEIRRHLIPLFVVGCINLAFPFVLYAFASLYLPAGFTSILNATTPLFGRVISFVWLREKLTWSQFVGLIAGFIGVAVLVGWTNMPMTSSFVLAVLAGLSAAMMYAIAAPYAKQKLSGVSPITIATGSQLSAALVLLPLTPFFLPKAPITLEVWAVVLALALFSTALAYIIYFHLIGNIGINKSLTVTYLVPLFAMFWGATVLNEPLTTSTIAGCSLILTGVAIALYR